MPWLKCVCKSQNNWKVLELENKRSLDLRIKVVDILISQEMKKKRKIRVSWVVEEVSLSFINPSQASFQTLLQPSIIPLSEVPSLLAFPSRINRTSRSTQTSSTLVPQPPLPLKDARKHRPPTPSFHTQNPTSIITQPLQHNLKRLLFVTLLCLCTHVFTRRKVLPKR